jgi:hypothetical protein
MGYFERENRNIMNLLLWINQSNGDTLAAIPLMEAIIKQFPHVNIKFACFKSQSYLVRHLPIQIIEADGNYRNLVMRTRPDYFLKKIKPFIQPEDTLIHLWGGNYGYKGYWQDQVKTFNNQCQEKNIDLILDDSEFGYIELPIVDVNVKSKAVFVENCQPVSGQTAFQFDMYKLGLMFPKINFYTVGPVDFTLNNVHDCSDKTLIELSNISRKCQLILGKGSGPFYSTLNKQNENKTKLVMGLFPSWRYKYWKEDDESILLLDTEQEIFEFLRPINRGS